MTTNPDLQRYVSPNGMRHTYDCWHFDDKPTHHLATPEEMRTLPACRDCAASVDQQAGVKPVTMTGTMTPTVARRRVVSESEALRFNPRWSDQDRERVRGVVRQYAPSYMYVTPSQQYISGRDDLDQPLFWIGRGYITDGDDKEIANLSTHLEAGERTTQPDVSGSICPVCHTERSRTGECWCS